MIMNAYRSNVVLFGMPIVQLIYGEGQLGIMSMLIAVIVPLFNILSVIVLESLPRSESAGIPADPGNRNESADHCLGSGLALSGFGDSSVETRGFCHR